MYKNPDQDRSGIAADLKKFTGHASTPRQVHAWEHPVSWQLPDGGLMEGFESALHERDERRGKPIRVQRGDVRPLGQVIALQLRIVFEVDVASAGTLQQQVANEARRRRNLV